MLKEAYDSGALAALIDAGFVKEAGGVKDTAKLVWNATKNRIKGVGSSVKDSVKAMREARAAGRNAPSVSGITLSPEHAKALRESAPELMAAAKPTIAEAEKKVLHELKPYLATAVTGAGIAGTGYGGYKLLQSLFPHADSDRFNHPVKAMFGLGDDD